MKKSHHWHELAATLKEQASKSQPKKKSNGLMNRLDAIEKALKDRK